MTPDEEHLQSIRRYFARLGVEPEKFLSLHGFSPAEGAAYIEAAERDILDEFDRLRRDRPDLVAFFERDRAHLEQMAARFGTTYERELASMVVMRARYENQINSTRQRKRPLKTSDFKDAPDGKPPPGIDDFIPSDLLPNDNEIS